MTPIYLSLGSNLGDRKSNLVEAVQQLAEKIGILKISSVYETEPVGFLDQGWFLNIAISGTTEMNPHQLLSFTQSIEKTMKRVKTHRNGPRIIDIDIILFGDELIQSEQLTVPHPRLQERLFVLIPLQEISPELIIQGRGIQKLVEEADSDAVKRWGELNQ